MKDIKKHLRAATESVAELEETKKKHQQGMVEMKRAGEDL